MAFFSGNGGTVTVGAIVLQVTKWSANLKNKLVENSHSGTNGASNYEPVVADPDWSIEGGWDAAAQPDAAGLVGGAKVTLTLKMGASSLTTVIANTTVESVLYTDDNQSDIVRFTASGKGGSYTHPVG